MKNLHTKALLGLASAALALTACTTDNTTDNVVPANSKTVTMTVEAGSKQYDEARTTIGADNKTVKWNATGEVLAIVYNAGGQTLKTNTKEYTVDEAGKAVFTTEITPVEGVSAYTFGAVYPSSAVQSANSLSNISLKVPYTQTPVDGSYDPNTDLLMSQTIDNPSIPANVSFSFTRLVAFARMTLKGLTPGETVSEVKFTGTVGTQGAAQPYLAGNVAAHLTKYEHPSNPNLNGEAGTAHYNGPSYSESFEVDGKSITLDLSRANCVANDQGEAVVWFTTFPVDLSGGSFSVKATTENGNYEKTVDLGSRELNLMKNRVTAFAVKFESPAVAFDGYTLVTDASQLVEGAQIVIAGANSGATTILGNEIYSSSSMGTIKGYKGTQVTITDDGIPSTEAEAGKVFTLGKDGEFYTLSTSAGYLYGKIEGSFIGTKTLSEQTEIDDYARWKITVKNNVATFTTKYASENFFSQYISTGACFGYNTASANVYIFQKVGGGSEPAPATPTYELNLKSVGYQYMNMGAMGLGSLALFESETTDDPYSNNIQFGLFNPEQTGERLIAGTYSIVQELDYSSVQAQGGIFYNGGSYAIIPAEDNSLVLSYKDASKPNLLTVTFKVTTMAESGEEAIFTGEWSGEMNYGPAEEQLDLQNATSSYYYQHGSGFLTLSDAAAGLEISLALHNDQQLGRRLVAGTYPIAPLDGTTAIAAQGSITYNNKTYIFETVADKSNTIGLYYDDPTKPDLLRLSFTSLRAFNYDNPDEIVLLTGEWEGTVDFGPEVHILQPKSAVYSYMGMGNLTLFEGETTDDPTSNNITLGLINPQQTDAHLVDGIYPLMDEGSYDGSTSAMRGQVLYNGTLYDLFTAGQAKLSTDASTNELTVVFTVTANTTDNNGDPVGDPVIFTGKWTGEIDYSAQTGGGGAMPL